MFSGDKGSRFLEQFCFGLRSVCQGFKKIPCSIEVFRVIVSLDSNFLVHSQVLRGLPTDSSIGEVFCPSLLSEQSLLIYDLPLRATP